MNHESKDDYKSQPLEKLLNDWQAGKLNEEQKEYVISKVPIMGYVEKNTEPSS